MKTNYFNEEPKINVNLHNKEMPFTLLNNVLYTSSVIDGEVYKIGVNKGFKYDGATIPRFLWRIIGSQYNPEFLPAALIHDRICIEKTLIPKHGVKVSSRIFRDILVMYGVSNFKAWVMSTAVQLFQYTQKGWK